MALKDNFGDKLREWRKSHKWLQKEAAEALKVSLDTYRSWEYNNGAPHDSPSMTEILSRMEEAK